MKRKSRHKLSPEAQTFLSRNYRRWNKAMRIDKRKRIRQFDSWLLDQGLKLSDLSADDLFRYCGQPLDGPATNLRLIVVRDFLIWCHKHRILAPDTKQLFPRYLDRIDIHFPENAQSFIASLAPKWKQNSVVQVRFAIIYFHRWMKKRQIDILELIRKKVQFCFDDFRQEKSRSNSVIRNLQISVRMYLDWLTEQGEISEIDLSGLVPPARNRFIRGLTPSAREYLGFLPAVVKPNTCKLHLSALGQFCMFMQKNGITEENLTRANIEAWLKSQVDKGLSPNTRQLYILRVRRYLYWRYDRGYQKQNPDKLISTADVPKRPKLLPRPFPLALDMEILRRLRQSEHLYHRAILLLRRTGMRSNELWKLPTNCIHQDHSGIFYLKVPLGKMNNERLVPLDSETLALIKKIQEQSALARNSAGNHQSELAKLVYGPSNSDTFYHLMRGEFKTLTADLVDAIPFRLHRLRHTFATEMLNAGMSLYGVMHLLGHRHAGTTLIYAAIVQVTICEEFFAAQEKLKTRYATTISSPAESSGPLTPIALADDLARALRRLRSSNNPTTAENIRRLLK